MITNEDIADLTFHHMGRTGFRPFLVVIGAMDGVSFDEFHGYVSMYHWSGLYVEPMPEQFRRLQTNLAESGVGGDNRYENSAIADHDGTVQMLTINQQAVDEGKVHQCFGGMSTIYPPRNGLASPDDAVTVATHGELIEVPCITLATLFKRHAIDRVDILCLDAEGWDYQIIRQLDFSTYRPRLIRCEYVNLTPQEQSAIVQLFEDHEYVIRIAGQDITAVAADYWQELNTERPAVPASIPIFRPGNQTIVTALFDLSAGETALQLRRGFGLFIENAKRLLSVSWPMVIFAQPELDEMIRRFRSPANTYIVHKTLADLQNFPFYDRVQEIRSSSAWLDHAAGTPLEQRLPLYSPFAFSKQFFLNDAALYNPFRTEYFVWLDGDIAGAIGDPQTQLTTECERHLSAILSDGRMLYVGRPLTSDAEVDGFSTSAMAELAGRKPAHVVRGRVFGGTRRIINAINGIYYGYLGQSLNAGYLGNEDQILTIISCTHRSLCNVQMLDASGRLRVFFDRLQHGVPEHVDASA